MKKYTLLLAAAIVAAASFAQTAHTVSNNLANPAQFTEIQAAINAAADGDTIYVAGSATGYGNVLVNKRIVLIGAGYQQTGANTRTLISELDIVSSTDNGGGSGSRISGLLINANLDGDPDQIISDVIIERCLINRGDLINVNFGLNENWIFRNNIVYQDQNNVRHNFLCGAAVNLRLENNIFQGESSSSTNNAYFQVRSSSAIVTNNVFFDYTIELDDALVTNNIFLDQSFTDLGVVSSNSTFNNNIFNGESTPGTSTNTLNNNLNSDPGFVNENNRFFDFGEDLNLTTASPGKSAGTDGTDIGVYGGNFPIVFEPSNPQITQLLINTVQIPVGGELEFTVQAEGRQ